MYYNARYYDPQIGIFISPDTIVPDPTNLLDYNRYMYVRGRPLVMTDPSGHICVWGLNVGNTCEGSTDWDAVQLSLDAIGVAEPTPFADGASAVISVVRGNYGDAGFSALGMFPYVGDLAKGGKYVDEVVAGAKYVGQKADDAWQATKKWVNNLPCLVNSFSADTLVMTASGAKPIAELSIGDIVLAYNEETGEIGPYPITDTISHIDPEIVLLTIDGERIETTADHPFYVMDTAPWLAEGQTAGRWVDAGELAVGDDVWRADGATGDVELVEVVAVQQRMYNLTVDTAHTFFVGDGQWLVHNAGPCGGKIASGHAAGHLHEFADLGIHSVDELAGFIDNIVRYPDLSNTKLPRGRKAYWQFDPGDDFYGTLVFIDPKHVDGGTVFRPQEGIDYAINFLE